MGTGCFVLKIIRYKLTRFYFIIYMNVQRTTSQQIAFECTISDINVASLEFFFLPLFAPWSFCPLSCV